MPVPRPRPSSEFVATLLFCLLLLLALLLTWSTHWRECMDLKVPTRIADPTWECLLRPE